MRLLLFTGKGGVGKTTTAAATAVHAARCGVRTLVASADTAHSLGDALGIRAGSAPVEIETGLFAQQVDARARGERSWRQVQEYLLAVLDELGVDPLAAEELTDFPGAAEVMGLLEIRDQVLHGDWDLVVLDCAPTAETLRLLTVPDVLRRYVQRLLPMERRIARMLAAGVRPGRTAGGLPRPGDHVVQAAERLSTELAGVREVLTAPTTTVRLVTTAESVVLAETRRTWTTLALHGFPVDAVVVNRVFPATADDAWRRGWAAAQQERLAEAAASFAPARLLIAGYADAEPVGLTALRRMGEALYGPVAPTSAASVLGSPRSIPGPRVERDGDAFVLALDLPLAAREDLELGRRGDELLVSVAGQRRVISLPSALRRCRVDGAALRKGSLDVRFVPDPNLWRAL